MSSNLIRRLTRWVILSIAFAALLAPAGSVWTDIVDMQSAFSGFRLIYLFPVLFLTLMNCGRCFIEWHDLLRRLDIPMPMRDDIWNVMAGLAMAISPGKVGNLLKPYVFIARCGASTARSISARPVTEPPTDGIAIIVCSSVSMLLDVLNQRRVSSRLGGQLDLRRTELSNAA